MPSKEPVISSPHLAGGFGLVRSLNTSVATVTTSRKLGGFLKVSLTLMLVRGVPARERNSMVE